MASASFQRILATRPGAGLATKINTRHLQLHLTSSSTALGTLQLGGLDGLELIVSNLQPYAVATAEAPDGEIVGSVWDVEFELAHRERV